ncbi:heme ABC transporter substrate-binding protein IsdE [Hathewaya massiliensis]|uniref:heme ABC transporter substrate-binding protein IsdE n=1 Tax=Hathewaya massiliensis TaxID=1964382 RepID=UPI00115B0B4B|nr:heme ABC transporter substrate-binding protein IsdE [Hathewaya massiliensis]
MKKFLSILMAIIISVTFVSCGRENKTESCVNKNNGEKKIVAGSMAVAEMLAKLDIKIVGRPSTQYGISDKIKDVPEIGLAMKPDLEKIRSLNPDVYVTSGALQEMIGDQIKANRINAKYCDLSSYKAVKETIKELAKEYGKEEKGEKILKEFENKEKEILKDTNPNKKVKVMILFGAPGNFMLATEKSFAGSLIAELGGENIASKVDTKIKGPYVPFSLEVALKENPDIIFRMYHGYIDEAKKQVNEEFKRNPQWSKFKAVKEEKIYDLDPIYFGVTGDVKAMESLEKMKEYLYKK